MLWWREAINLVRKYEFLYDMKSKDYKDDEMNDNNMDRDCKGDDDGPGKFHQESYFALKQELIFINMVNYHSSLWSQRSFHTGSHNRNNDIIWSEQGLIS